MGNSNVKYLFQRIKNVYHFFDAWFWVWKCGYPAKKLVVVGVTGTDGKTTTCTLLYEMCKAAGIRSGLLSTVSAKYVDRAGAEKEIQTGLHTTNPDARQLQPILKEMVEQGVTHMILEVTAHGLDQFRVVGCNFKVGVFTNLTREHLDDFATMERYREAKFKLFRWAKIAVLNAEDPASEYFKMKLKNTQVEVQMYKKAEIKEVNKGLSGAYNLSNISGAMMAALAVGIPRDVCMEVIKSFPGVIGRREEIKTGKKFRVIVDFAHTPNALQSILQQLRSETPKGKKLIVVFGCTGGRDQGKRPMMGQAAVNLADVVIVTSDDTRDEDQNRIYRQIVSGISTNDLPRVIKENDRERAINLAVETARAGDVVVIAGKGHERTILHGKTEYPWSDPEQVVKAVAKMKAKE